MSETKAAADGYASPSAPAATVTAAQLADAVARGIITAEQRDRLLALREGAAGVEARSGLNLVSVGYWTGSIAVIFALAWFLADRWKSLHPGGVLAVGLLYATAFALSSFLLRRLGYRTASSLLALLTVGMAPVILWAVESLLGLWPTGTFRQDYFAPDLVERIRWVPLQLSVALAALIALRWVPFGLFALAVSIPMGMALVQSTPWFFDPELTFRLGGWMTVLASTLMLLAAFLIERRAGGDAEDYTGWTYLAAAGFMVFGVMDVSARSDVIRHLMPLVVALLVGIALTARRRVFLVPAVVFFVAYLAFLATDVFQTAVGFMLVMLTVGAAIILGTVVMQRRYPGMLGLFTRDPGERRATRELGMVYGALAVLAFVMLFAAQPGAREELQRRRDEMWQARVAQRRAVVTRRAAPTPAETRPTAKP